jgi:hypothetical protein
MEFLRSLVFLIGACLVYFGITYNATWAGLLFAFGVLMDSRLVRQEHRHRSHEASEEAVALNYSEGLIVCKS